jgi:hypothetical protein
MSYLIFGILGAVLAVVAVNFGQWEGERAGRMSVLSFPICGNDGYEIGPYQRDELFSVTVHESDRASMEGLVKAAVTSGVLLVQPCGKEFTRITVGVKKAERPASVSGTREEK